MRPLRRLTPLRPPRLAAQEERMTPTVVGDTGTRVMLGLLWEHSVSGRATVRTVADRAGVSVRTCHAALLRLRALGLAAHEPGTNGTLRPLVQPVPVAERAS